MNKTKLPKVILVDWHQTLSFSQFWGHIKQKDKELFVRIETCLFNQNKNLINPWMRGQITSEQICKTVSSDLNLPFDYIYKEFIKSCKKMNLSGKNVVRVITNIRNKGVKFYIFTDNMDSFNRWTVPHMKLDTVFDGIVNSNTIGFLKNDIDNKGKNLFLSKILKQEEVKTSDIMLIDDNPNTINNFSKYGLICKLVTVKNNLEDI